MNAFERINNLLKKAGDWAIDTEYLGQLNFIRARYRNSLQVVKECEAVRKAIKADDNREYQIHTVLLNAAIDAYNTRHLGVTPERKKTVTKEVEPLIKEHYEKKFGDEE